MSGVMKGFSAIVKMVRHGYLHEYNEELDLIRSEWPFGSADTGFLSFTGGSAGPLDSFDVGIASGQLFHLKTLMLNNPQEGQVYHLFDGPGTSVPSLKVQVGQSQTEFITGLQGFVFQSVPCASATSSAGQLKMGGLIRERSNE